MSVGDDGRDEERERPPEKTEMEAPPPETTEMEAPSLPSPEAIEDDDDESYIDISVDDQQPMSEVFEFQMIPTPRRNGAAAAGDGCGGAATAFTPSFRRTPAPAPPKLVEMRLPAVVALEEAISLLGRLIRRELARPGVGVKKPSSSSATISAAAAADRKTAVYVRKPFKVSTTTFIENMKLSNVNFPPEKLRSLLSSALITCRRYFSSCQLGDHAAAMSGAARRAAATTTASLLMKKVTGKASGGQWRPAAAARSSCRGSTYNSCRREQPLSSQELDGSVNAAIAYCKRSMEAAPAPAPPLGQEQDRNLRSDSGDNC